MVNFQEQGAGAPWNPVKSVQAFHQLRLPQRQGTVQGLRMEMGARFVQGRPVALAGQRRSRHVIIEVECRVLHPVCLVQFQGHRFHLAAQHGEKGLRQVVKALPEGVVQSVGAALARRVVDHYRRHVQWNAGHFALDHQVVETTKLPHRCCPVS